MEDRELLELAAKAARIDLYPKDAWRDTKNGIGLLLENGGYIWNPIYKNVDAFRLMVQLQIDVSFINGDTHADGQSEGGPSKHCNTRRAIVRAAAAIGKAMP